MITPELLQILQHSLGVDQYGQGEQFRNHFVTGSGSVDWPLCNKLVECGFMGVRRNHPLAGGDDAFWVTDEGKRAMAEHSPKPPTLRRSQARYARYREYGDSFGSFIDFCRWDAEPERSWNGGAG